jgi:hypothetical protein
VVVHRVATKPLGQGRYPPRLRALSLAAVGLANLVVLSIQERTPASAAVAILVVGSAVLWLLKLAAHARARRRFRAEYGSTFLWLSKPGCFLGPFGGAVGLIGTAGFESPGAGEPGVVVTRLLLTTDGIQFTAPRSHLSELVWPFEQLSAIDVFPPRTGGLLARLTINTGTAWKRGRIVISGVHGEHGTFAGTNLNAVPNLLAGLGASLHHRNEADG